MPGPPRRVEGVGAMLLFGGTLSLNGIVIYVAYNIEKVLLGEPRVNVLALNLALDAASK